MEFDALAFLYIALGVGFISLAIFGCIALYHIIRVLRDVADASEHIRDTAESLSDNVTRLGNKVTDAVEHISDYVVKPLSVMQMLMSKFQPFIDMVSGFGAQAKDEEEEEEEKPKRRRRGGKRKKK